MFTDHSIDIRTGELLGRYIAEERDSGRILKSCYEALKARGGKSRVSTSDDSRLSALETKLDAVCAAIGDMQTMLAGSAKRTNGARAKTKA
ncbi:MAG: hypothetical protein JO054_06220 [Actinobacteria bacterium]|nr:hypothetical protein [Actinomycetota bacterium]